MDYLMIVMRIIHIFTGVFWVGASFFILSFVQPTVIATGEEGQKFMQHLSFRTKFSTVMLGIAVLNLVSGLVMYWRIFEFNWDVLRNGYGLVLTLGAIAAFFAFLTGYFIQNRGIARMKVLSAAIAASGGPPSDDQLVEIRALSGAVSRGGKITSIFLGLALLGMAIAQYVVF